MSSIISSRRVLSLLVVVAAGALVASACQPVGTPRSRAAVCKVAVIGDSLTVGADSQGLRQAFAAARCQAFVNARVGRPTSEGATLAENMARVGWMPDILVVALGTNDWDGRTFERHARRVLAAAGNRPVVWVNVFNGADPARADRINSVLVRLQVERSKQPGGGNLWVWDHNGFARANRGLVARDGYHLTSAGYRAHAANIVRSVTG